MRQPDPKRLWEELAEVMEWHHDSLSFDEFLDDRNRGKLLKALHEFASKFRAWEVAHPDYRPQYGCFGEDGDFGPDYVTGQWDICAGLHLLKVAVELAEEVNQQHTIKERANYWRQVAEAKIEAEGSTRH